MNVPAERVRALDLASLRGRRAAWVDRWSAGGYLMPRRMLRERGLNARDFEFVRLHPPY